MLNRFLDWLLDNCWTNLIILFVYFGIAVLPHEIIGISIAEIFAPYSRDTYNTVLLYLGLIGFLLYLILVFWKKSVFDKSVLFYLVLNTFFSILCYQLLFVVNVEAIHFLQYGIFAVICFPLAKNYTLTLIYTTIAGSIDEAYQFYYLAPDRTEYYDFNDIIINLIGGVFGLLIVRSLLRTSFKYDLNSFLKTKHFFILISFFLCIVTLLASGLLVKNYDPQNVLAKFWLIRTPAEGFWNLDTQFNFKFHVVQPWEGIFIVASLLLMYSRLYKGVPLLNKD